MNKDFSNELDELIDEGLDAARGIFWWAVVPLLAGIGVVLLFYWPR